MNGFNSYHPYLFPPESTMLVLRCFSVLPVEGFSPASLLDLSSGLSVVVYQYGLTKETKFLSTTDLYCLLLSRICCSPPLKSKQDLPRPPSHVGRCLAPLPACQEKVLEGSAHPGRLPSADATPPLLPEASLSLPKKRRGNCHHLCPISVITLNRPAGFGDGVLHHVHSWRRVAIFFFYFF